MAKYYICNNFKFYVGLGELIEKPNNAKGMKSALANSYVRNYPDKYQAIRYRSSNTGKDYILSTPQQYIGNDVSHVSEMRKAKAFCSLEDVCKYILEHENLRSQFGMFYRVIDEKYSPIPMSEIDRIIKELTSPKETEIKKENSLPATEPPKPCLRKQFSPTIKNAVFIRSGGKCCICGKPLNGDFTIDHIVPLSRFGTNDESNLRAVHKRCNQLKGKFLDDELVEVSGDVMANFFYNNPQSEISLKVVRAIVRGTINQRKCM